MECGREFQSLNTHIRKHHLNSSEYKLKYPSSKMNSDELVERRNRASSISQKKNYQNGKQIHWTKTVDKSVAKDIYKKSVSKSSQTRREKFASGELIPWQTGLTKNTDQRVMNVTIAATEGLKNCNFSGSANPMYQTCSHKIWTIKFGIDEANRRRKNQLEKFKYSTSVAGYVDRFGEIEGRKYIKKEKSKDLRIL